MQEQRLNLKQEQKQIVTPAQLQALHLLTLAVQELNAFISEQLLENPVLELAEPAENDSFQQPERERPPEPEEDGWREPEIAQTAYEDWGYGSGGGAMLRETAAEQNGLAQQLLLQAAFLPARGETERAVKVIINALDSDGYLRVSLEELAEKLNLDPAALAEALSLVQTLEPKGVAARDLRECLRLQVPAEHRDRELLIKLINGFLPELAAGKIKAAAKACGVGESLVEQAYARIQAMDPRPAAALATGGAVQYIIPDLAVRLEEDRIVIVLNDSIGPRLSVNQYYAELSAAPGNDAELTEYLHRQLSAARMLIRNVERRHDTIAAIAEIVFSRQRQFFVRGVAGLRPLTMKEVAEAAELHESTVSRTVAGKYVETPRGLLAWRFFFPRSLETAAGQTVSDTFAKSLIAEMIGKEDRRRPLSDEHLCRALKEQGLVIARRTVAKYRAALGLPGQSGRRVKK